jgi:DNA repair protein RadC
MSSIHKREITKMAKSEIFKCTEQEGYYSISEIVSEQDIITFAKTIIAARFKRGTTISSPQASSDFFKSQIGHYENEVFAAIFLDSKHRIIAFEELFIGTIDHAAVPPSEKTVSGLES